MSEWAGTLDGTWEHPGHRRVWNAQARLARVIRFDPRGIGTSDSAALEDIGDLGDWATDAVAVLDAVRADKVAVIAEGYAGHAAITLAAAHAERISKLLLVNCFGRMTRCDDYAAGVDASDVTHMLERMEALWGSGAVVESSAPGLAGNRDFCARFERLAAGPTTAAAMLGKVYSSDIRNRLPCLQMPIGILYTGDLANVGTDTRD